MESTPAQSQNPPQVRETPQTLPQKKSILPLLVFAFVFVLLLVLGLGGYYIYLMNSGKTPEKPQVAEKPKGTGGEVLKPRQVVASQFATYQEVPVNVSPKVASYTVSQTLSNVTNKDDFTLSASAKNLLIKNAFVVVPSDYNLEFFQIYESNRYSFIPSFVTTDSLVHNYHLMFDHLLKNLEEDKLAGQLKILNSQMLAASLEQYNSLKGTEWENAAKRDVGFFAVASKLLDTTVSVPAIVKNEVEQELTLIAAHAGIKGSPVMNIGSSGDVTVDSPQGPQPLEGLKEDYSQYVPRGHYDKTELLKAYFKSMMWYGRLTFRLKSEDETKSAVLITLLLNNENSQKVWNSLYEPINFFVGKADDITYYQFKDLVEQVYGKGATLQSVSGDKNKLNSITALAKKLEPPQINSMPIFNAAIQSNREEEIKGFRFMGQRFTIDASVFQRLITREVGEKGDSCSKAPFTSGRMLPKGLDVPAAMGSKEALNILKAQGETQYACYPENMEKMKTYIAGLNTDIWTQNLYWGWLYSLLPLTKEKGEGYPSFMRNLAWARKGLNTYLGSWTELKHDTILYAKQVYAELGGGPPEEKDDRGYVEPDTFVYARLAGLIKMTKEGLISRGILSAANKDSLDKLESLALSFKTISEKELNNEALTKDEYELIKSYGGSLEHFWLEAFKDEGVTSKSQLDDKPAAIVADVATDPNGQVLEEGTGYIAEIFAVVPIEGKLRIAKGGVYSYYEFPWPMSDRLTDAKWREMLKTGKAPKLPDWTSEFMVPIEKAETPIKIQN